MSSHFGLAQTMPTIVFIIVGGLALVNVLVCVFVFRSDYYSFHQKCIQSLIVWFVPILGPLLVGAFLYGQRDSPLYNTRAYPERSDKGVWAVAEPIIHEGEGHGGGGGDT